jgi:N-acetylneuraminic acid mutarotase
MGCKSSKDTKALKANKIPDSQPKPQDPPTQVSDVSKKYEVKEDVAQKTITYTGDHPLITKAYNPSSKAKSANPDTKCYFFGIDEDGNQKIFKFTPKDHIFEPVTIPSGLDVYNLSAVVYVSETEIYLTGGANSDISSVSKKAFLYNAKENKVTELAPMYTGRYAHCSLIHEGYLYVFGGLEVEKEPPTTNTNGEAFHEEESSLMSCERYSIKDNKWEKIPNLNLARSLASCFIFENEIHVVGGYLAKTKRTPTIERFSVKENKWHFSKAKLPKGLEASFVFSPFEDTIQVIGGQGSWTPELQLFGRFAG